MPRRRPLRRWIALLLGCLALLAPTGCAQQAPQPRPHLPGATTPGPPTPGPTMGSPIPGPAGRTPASAPVSVYFVPHQDDELISMAGGITADVAAGRQIWLVLVHDGSTSGERRVLCARQRWCLSPGQFVAARDREFVDSARALGVARTHVELAALAADLPDRPGRVAALVAGVVARFGPDATYNAVSYLDRHPDHVMVANALRQQCRADALPRCRYFQSPLYRPGVTLPGAFPLAAPGAVWLPAPARRVRVAVAAYRRLAPREGRYAIGWHSVRHQLQYVADHPGSLVHGDEP